MPKSVNISRQRTNTILHSSFNYLHNTYQRDYTYEIWALKDFSQYYVFFQQNQNIFNILAKKKIDNNLIYGSDSGSERMTYSGEASLCSQYRHIFARVAGLGESLPGLLSTLLHQHSTVLTLYKLVEVKFLVYLCYKI